MHTESAVCAGRFISTKFNLKTMTTTEFYNFAILAAKERGYTNPDITVHTICTSSGIANICKLWDHEKKKHISSAIQSNPVSAIQAFKDAIEFENKRYSEIQEDVEL